MNTQLLIFAGSLAGVAFLVLVSAWLRLGPRPAIADAAQARALASEAADSFDALDIALDAEGRGALAGNAQGRIMLIVPHGAHFAARMLGPGAGASRDGPKLTVHSGDRTFPVVTLDLGDAAEAWDTRIKALHSLP